MTVWSMNDGLVMLLSDSAEPLNRLDWFYNLFIPYIQNIYAEWLQQTIKGVHRWILDAFFASLEKSGQVTVPNTCHLQYEQKNVKGIEDKFSLKGNENITDLRVQGMNSGYLPLLGKHISHEKVAPRGDCAIQTVLLSGKVDLGKSSYIHTDAYDTKHVQNACCSILC